MSTEIIYYIEFGSEKLPLKINSIEIPCFILENKKKMFSLSGVQKALGYEGKSENWLLDLLQNIQKFVEFPEENIKGLKYPFTIESVNVNSNFKTQAIDCSLLISMCNIIVNAKTEGFLNVNQLKFAKKAESILEVLTIENLTAKIEEATGFLLYKDDLLTFLEKFLSEKLNDPVFHWSKTLPDLFFESIFYQQQLDWKDLKKNPYIVGKLINDLVFSRISNELLQELRAHKPKRSYKSKLGKSQKKEHPALKEFISNQMSLLKASGYQWNTFLQLLNQIQPKNSNFTTKFPLFPEIDVHLEIEPTFFNTTLIKGIIKN